MNLNCVQRGLTIGCWNINGLQSKSNNKLIDPTFLETVHNLDIFALVETHTNGESQIDIPGYTSCHKFRKRSVKATRDHAGIAIYVKD